MAKWSKIKTSAGNAAHVPKSIVKLFAKSEAERVDAYWELDNYVIVQSDLYEAAYYVIEPIVNELENRYDNDKYWALVLLNEIIEGGSGHLVIQLSELNETKDCFLDEACKEKFHSLKERIRKIIVKSEREQEQLKFLLNSID